MNLGIELAERGVLPDAILRWAIHRQLAQRAALADRLSNQEKSDRLMAFVRLLSEGPIARSTQRANEQHYELPSEFFTAFLGPRRKYSACLWPSAQSTLAQAEDAMLKLTCERAGLANGQDILELGCGWGSLAFWIAEHYPDSRILAVSNSRTQRAFIEAESRCRGLTRLRVQTADLNSFDPGQTFDRVVSVECFEHLRNYEELFRRIRSWLRPDGKLFVHVFCHRGAPYVFDGGDTDWMGKHFFQDGLMPSGGLLRAFDHDLTSTASWQVDGTHYARTLRAWLEQFDRHAAELRPILRAVYGADAHRWRQRWRLFLQACAELFDYQAGRTWFVQHELFEPVGKP